MKKDAYYFSHDCNAKDDPKCVLLIEQLGLEGYGIFWILVETLREQPNFKYPIILLPALARRFNTTTEKLKAVVYNYMLFKIENEELFYSESLIERMNILANNREKRSLAGRKGNEKRWKEQKSIANVSQCDRNASQVKYSIEEYSKEEESILLHAKKEIVESSSFEQLLMQRHITKIDGLKKLDEFIIEQELSGEYKGKPIGEIIKHFINWLRTSKLHENIVPLKKQVSISCKDFVEQKGKEHGITYAELQLKHPEKAYEFTQQWKKEHGNV